MEPYMSLSLQELQQDYAAMSECYKQQIHELKRHLETANAAQEYLTAELELTASKTPPKKNSNRTEQELEHLRHVHNELKTEHAALQLKYEVLCEEQNNLRKQLQAAESELTMQIQESKALTSHNERIEILEKENIDLIQKLDQLHEKDIHNACTQLHLHKSIEMLQDQLTCLEQNLHSNRQALDEKTFLLESTQEELVEVNVQLAALKATPNDVARKGNSLFAELDDQRQDMKKLLARQKESYLEMKSSYDASEHKIRRLKRENAAMHTELQACLSIFCNADKMYQEKLNERIKQLTNQNEDLEKKIKWTQERLRDIANTNGVLWLESMFNFCKQETEDLKQQVHSSCIQKASLEERLRNVQQEMARWRFEALKLRCLILNRENLLNEHKISFKSSHSIEFRITEKHLSSAQPNIFQFSTDSETIAEKELLKDKDIRRISPKNPTTSTLSSTTSNCITSSPPTIKVETETKENLSYKQAHSTDEEQLECKNTTSPRSSILCKLRDENTTEQSTTNVQFLDKDLRISTEECKTPLKTMNVTTMQTKLGTKPNIIVRRIIVGTKP